MYADELHTVEFTEYVSKSGITNAAGLKSTPNQGLGALIWTHQTCPDIVFALTQMTTQIAESCESPEKSTQLARLYNKMAKFVKNHQRKIRYILFPTVANESPRAPNDLLSWKLFYSLMLALGFVKNIDRNLT